MGPSVTLLDHPPKILGGREQNVRVRTEGSSGAYEGPYFVVEKLLSIVREESKETLSCFVHDRNVDIGRELAVVVSRDTFVDPPNRKGDLKWGLNGRIFRWLEFLGNHVDDCKHCLDERLVVAVFRQLKQS